MKIANFLLRAQHIFVGQSNIINNGGFVAICNDRIIASGIGSGEKYLMPETIVIELGNQTICPGFVDTHCFFTGYALSEYGIDLGACSHPSALISKLSLEGQRHSNAIIGRGLNSEVITTDFTSLIEYLFPYRPVILFDISGEHCWMNQYAEKHYSAVSGPCSPESLWSLLREMLQDQNFILPCFHRYMTLMNSRGITSVKEMGFDDFYGFAELLQQLDNDKHLSLRVHFMSQPVSKKADINMAKVYRDRYNSDFLRFSGFNRMTDGSISQLCGDLKLPYVGTPGITCSEKIDYSSISFEVLQADAADFRFALHAQGDAAIAKSLDIFDCCEKDSTGRLLRRHALTDVEFSDPEDLLRMGQLGVIAEIYPQIQSISDRSGKLTMLEEKIGMIRGQYYWNRRRMVDSGVVLSCATDLPLLIPDIPESIYHASGCFFPEGGEPFNLQNALTREEVLTAWTYGGAYNFGTVHELGTLKAGMKADIAVIDGDVLNASMDFIRNLKVSLTLIDGKVVYQNEERFV